MIGSKVTVVKWSSPHTFLRGLRYFDRVEAYSCKISLSRLSNGAPMKWESLEVIMCIIIVQMHLCKLLHACGGAFLCGYEV